MSSSDTTLPSGHDALDAIIEEIINDCSDDDGPNLTGCETSANGLEDGQNAVHRGASTILREHYAQGLRLFEATQAEVEALEKEKRQASEDNRLKAKRITKLETKLRTSLKEYSVLGSYHQAQDAVFQERIESLEQQLSGLERVKVPPSHKAGSSSKIAAASANLQKQFIEDLQKEKWELVKKMEEKDAKAKAQADQLQSTINSLEQDKESLQYRLDSRRRTSIVGPFGAISTQGLKDDGVEVALLQETIQELQAVIEQQKQGLEEYALAEAQAWEYYDETDEPIPENTNPQREELDELGPRPATASEPERDDAASSAPHTNEPETEQSKLETDEDTLQEQFEELEARNRGLQEQNKKWRMFLKTFMQRAADMLRKDTSKHQIKKGYKDLRKLVKDAGLQGL